MKGGRGAVVSVWGGEGAVVSVCMQGGRAWAREAVEEYLEAAFGIDALDDAAVGHRDALFIVVDAQAHADRLLAAHPVQADDDEVLLGARDGARVLGGTRRSAAVVSALGGATRGDGGRRRHRGRRRSAVVSAGAHGVGAVMSGGGGVARGVQARRERRRHGAHHGARHPIRLERRRTGRPERRRIGRPERRRIGRPVRRRTGRPERWALRVHHPREGMQRRCAGVVLGAIEVRRAGRAEGGGQRLSRRLERGRDRQPFGA